MQDFNTFIKQNKITVLGITGGVGSGKSMILDYLEKAYNAIVYKADDIGHDVIKKGTLGYEKIVKHFGHEILNSDEEIDRRLLGNIVFKSEKKLEFLNKIIHPAVKKYILEDIVSKFNSDGTRLFIIEAALLIESGYNENCTELWYIFADVDTRIERLMKSRGYTEEKCLNIIYNQLDEKEFREKCDFMINNDFDFEQTKIQIENHMKLCYNRSID